MTPSRATTSFVSFKSTASGWPLRTSSPRIVEFADELPKTESGKIKRAELRAAGPAAKS